MRQALRNALYLGKVSHKDDWFEGQHKAIIPEAEWQRVQSIMDGNARNRRGPPSRAKYNYQLSSLLRCSCGYAMTTSAGTGRSRMYFYYRCIGIQKKGNHICTVKQMPAEKLEEATIFKDRMEVDLYNGRHAVAWLARVRGERISVHTSATDREQAQKVKGPEPR